MFSHNAFPHHSDTPMAAAGLTSYRCKNRFGYTMIGAKNHDDAFNEARRSDPDAKREDLQIWKSYRYIDC